MCSSATVWPSHWWPDTWEIIFFSCESGFSWRGPFEIPGTVSIWKCHLSQQCNSQSSFLHNRNYFTDNTHTVCQNRDPHRPASNIRRTKYQNFNAPTTSEWSTVLLSAKVRLISVVWGYIETGQIFICLFQWGDTKNVFVFYFIPWHFKQVVEIHAEEIKVYVSKIGL